MSNIGTFKAGSLSRAPRTKKPASFPSLDNSAELSQWEPLTAWQQPDSVIYCNSEKQPIDLGSLLRQDAGLSYTVELSIISISQASADIWKVEAVDCRDEREVYCSLFFSYASAAFRDIIFSLHSGSRLFSPWLSFAIRFYCVNDRMRAEVSDIVYTNYRAAAGEELEAVPYYTPIQWEACSSLTLNELIKETGRMAGSLFDNEEEYLKPYKELLEAYNENPRTLADEEAACKSLQPQQPHPSRKQRASAVA